MDKLMTMMFGEDFFEYDYDEKNHALLLMNAGQHLFITEKNGCVSISIW